ncbi:MAG: hypothetical protein WC476_12675 [Phycisphaerae bacterium]|jgi:hypothetical protein
MAAGEVLGNGNTDGTNFGRSTDKIGFYGLATPIVKPTCGSAVATTASTTSTPYGYGTSTQADAIVTALNLTNTALRALGLCA